MADGRTIFSITIMSQTNPVHTSTSFNPLTPNDPHSGRTAPLTSKRWILYIYSTNTGTEYFKHRIYSPFSSLQNAVCFIILTYLVPVLFTFYIQDVLKYNYREFFLLHNAFPSVKKFCALYRPSRDITVFRGALWQPILPTSNWKTCLIVLIMVFTWFSNPCVTEYSAH